MMKALVSSETLSESLVLIAETDTAFTFSFDVRTLQTAHVASARAVIDMRPMNCFRQFSFKLRAMGSGHSTKAVGLLFPRPNFSFGKGPRLAFT